MSEFFFDIPWVVTATLAVVGIGLFIWANNRMRQREKRVGLGLIGLAGALVLFSYLMETDREIVARRTRELVAAVVGQDSQGIGRLLDARATAYGWDKQEIMEGTVFYARETELTGARVISLEVREESRDLVSHLAVWSQHSGAPRFPVTNLNSTWKILWIKRADQWLIYAITPIQIGQTMGEDVQRRYLDRPAGERGRH